MTESEALANMVAPGTKRPSIWRGGVLQIIVCRACDLACTNCTQLSNTRGLGPNFMSPDMYEKALDSLQGYWGVIGAFGGNPCIHPKFGELCEILRAKTKFEQRGLWSNNPMGKGKICRVTFNPEVSNLNVHQVQSAYDEFAQDWPECRKFLKGLDDDSRHGPPYVAMQDLDVIPNKDFTATVENTEENRWDLVGNCDINKYWSAAICVVNGELRAFFCEIAASIAMAHTRPGANWMGTGQPMPDIGMAVEPGWWQKPMQDFASQARTACHACGIPLKGWGGLATVGGDQVSKTHADIYKLKTAGKTVELVTSYSQLGENHLPKSTDYIENSSLV